MAVGSRSQGGWIGYHRAHDRAGWLTGGTGQAARADRTDGPARARRAFSLLEAIIATTVLAVAMVIVMESLSTGLSASVDTGREAAAHDLAADRLNRVACDAKSAESGETSVGGVGYLWRVEEGDQPGAGLRRILCTVTWQRMGRKREVKLQRIVSARRKEDVDS